jgi:uncharacterized protein YegJ (DUF2314 family)
MKSSVVAAIALGFVAVCGAGAWLVGSRIAASVVRVNAADPRLQEAIRRAQRELPDFLAQLDAPASGRRFAIRGRFRTPSGPEYLWVRNPVAADGAFRGTLDQEPMAARELRKGDEVRVAQADVVDWLIREPDGKMRGGYTEQALGR